MFLLDYLMDRLGYQKKMPWPFPAKPVKKPAKKVAKKTIKKPKNG
jgi:hypothetical protein